MRTELSGFYSSSAITFLAADDKDFIAAHFLYGWSYCTRKMSNREAGNADVSDFSIKDLYTLLCKEIEKKAGETVDRISQKLSEEASRLDERVRNLEDENSDLRERNERLDRQLRKNNIVVYGLTIGENNLLSEVAGRLSQLMHVEINCSDISDIYYVSKKAAERSVIVVKFVSFFKKLEVLKNLRQLKGSSVSISQDLTSKQRVVNAPLVRHLRAARQKKYPAFIKGENTDCEWG